MGGFVSLAPLHERFAGVLVAVTVMALSGCSFIAMTTAPSAPDERTEPAASECTTSMAPATADATGMLTSSLLLLLYTTMEEDSGTEGQLGNLNRTQTLALSATSLAVFTASTVYGLVQIKRCRELRNEIYDKKSQAPVWSPVMAEGTSVPAPAVPPSAAPPLEPVPSAVVLPEPPAAPSEPAASPPPEPTKPSVPTVSFPD
jgi:hypothetical protein